MPEDELRAKIKEILRDVDDHRSEEALDHFTKEIVILVRKYVCGEME